MDQLTPVILFGAAAIAGHTWGAVWLERLGLLPRVERAIDALRRFFDRD